MRKKYFLLPLLVWFGIFILMGCSHEKVLKKATELLKPNVIINEYLKKEDVPTNFWLANGTQDLRSQVEILLPAAKNNDKDALAKLKALLRNITFTKGMQKANSNLMPIIMKGVLGTNFYLRLDDETANKAGHELLLPNGSSGQLKVIAAPGYILEKVLVNEQEIEQELSNDHAQITIPTLTITAPMIIRTIQKEVNTSIKVTLLGNLANEFIITSIEGTPLNLNEIAINTRLLIKPKDQKDAVIYLNGERGLNIKGTGSVINIPHSLYLSTVNVLDVMRQTAIALLPSTLYSLEIPAAKVSKELAILRINPKESVAIIQKIQTIYDELKTLTTDLPANKLAELVNIVHLLEYGTSDEEQQVITFTNQENYYIKPAVAQYDLPLGKKLLYHPTYFNPDKEQFIFHLFPTVGHKIMTINYQEYEVKTVQNVYSEILVTLGEQSSSETSQINEYNKLECRNNILCHVQLATDGNEYSLTPESAEVAQLLPNSIAIFHVLNDSEEPWAVNKKYPSGSMFKVKKTETDDRRIIIFRKGLSTIHFDNNQELLFVINQDTTFFSEAQVGKLFYTQTAPLENGEALSTLISVKDKKYNSSLPYNVYNRGSDLEIIIALPQFLALETLSVFNRENNSEELHYGATIDPQYSKVKDISHEMLSSLALISYRVYRFNLKLLFDYELRLTTLSITYHLTFASLGDNTKGLNNSNYQTYVEALFTQDGNMVSDLTKISGGTTLKIRFKPILNSNGQEDSTAIHRVNINNNEITLDSKREASFLVSKNTTIDYGISYMAKIKIADFETSSYIEEIIPSIQEQHYEGTTIYIYIKPEFKDRIKAIYYTKDKNKQAIYDSNAKCYIFDLVRNTSITIKLK